MSTITLEEVHKLARLANIDLDDAMAQQMQKELSAILSFVEQLDGADTDSLQPTYQVTGLMNVMREDEQIDYGISPHELLKNAPKSREGSIEVERVL